MIPARPFLMIRHGQSEANLAEICSGHIDVALTDLGREQARAAGKIIAALPDAWKPRRIVHSHLSRARDTASLINESLGSLPMVETPDIAEQFFGDWENQPWDLYRAKINDCLDPEGGETMQAFQNRVKRALNDAFAASGDLPLVVCHGGVFRAFGSLYGQSILGIRNCLPYRFTPVQNDYPWEIAALTESA